jgi:hypothetical protein
MMRRSAFVAALLATTILTTAQINPGTPGGVLTLGGALTTTGSGPTTLALPNGAATFTYPAATDTLAGLGTAETFTANQSFNSGTLLLKGSSSGTVTLKPAAAAGSNTVTLPAGTTDFSATGGANQVVKQASAGGALTVGQVALSEVSGAPVTAQSGTVQPTGTTSLTAVMMGLANSDAGCKITPTRTGAILVIINGDLSNSLASDGLTYQAYTGTGTAPTNGTAPASAGTTRAAAGNAIVLTNNASTAALRIPFSAIAIVTGLTLSTQIWIDLALNANIGGTATAFDVACKAHEL